MELTGSGFLQFRADEHQTAAPVVAVAIRGGKESFRKAREKILMSRTAVLAFAESGGAADFIAAAYDAIQDKHNTLVLYDTTAVLFNTKERERVRFNVPPNTL